MCEGRNRKDNVNSIPYHNQNLTRNFSTHFVPVHQHTYIPHPPLKAVCSLPYISVMCYGEGREEREGRGGKGGKGRREEGRGEERRRGEGRRVGQNSEEWSKKEADKKDLAAFYPAPFAYIVKYFYLNNNVHCTEKSLIKIKLGEFPYLEFSVFLVEWLQ